MKTKNLMIFAAIAFLSFTVLSGCKNKPASQNSDKQAMSQEQLVQRGSYLVTIAGCNDCHTPKKMGAQGPEVNMALMLSGHPADSKLPPVDKAALDNGWVLFTQDLTTAAGPWGISFSANITPDASGIGNWPQENFTRALTQGKFKGIEGGRTLLPPMPWQDFAKLEPEDVNAIYAYLKSIPPVPNIVPMAVAPEDIK